MPRGVVVVHQQQRSRFCSLGRPDRSFVPALLINFFHPLLNLNPISGAPDERCGTLASASDPPFHSPHSCPWTGREYAATLALLRHKPRPELVGSFLAAAMPHLGELGTAELASVAVALTALG